MSVCYIRETLPSVHRIFLANPLFSRAHKNYTKHLFILRGPDILGLFCHVINTSIHIGKKFYSVRNISSVFLRYNYYYFLFCAFTYIFMHTHTLWEKICCKWESDAHALRLNINIILWLSQKNISTNKNNNLVSHW